MGFEGFSVSRLRRPVRQLHSESGSFRDSKRNEEAKLFQSAEATSGSKLVLLHDWWLVKSHPQSHGKQLGIGGFTIKNNEGIRSFTSAPIVERHDAVTLQTVDGFTIMLHGYLNMSRTLQNGFSDEVSDHFQIGFPYYWEDFASISVSDVFSAVCKTPAQKDSRSNMMSGNIFDATNANAKASRKEKKKRNPSDGPLTRSRARFLDK